MSIFLAVVVFIFLFIPGILSPFSQGGQADTASSNRVADQLAQGTLGSPSEPYVLNRYCTVEFFGTDDLAADAPSQCSYSGTSFEEGLGLEQSYQNINISIRNNATSTESLCWDPDDGLINETGSDCEGARTQLQRGDAVTASTDDTVTSRRVVSLNREDVALIVRMW
jgi:hypothetical protein